MTGAPILSDDPVDGSDAEDAARAWPGWARQPFPRFSHLGGLGMGASAGLAGAVVSILSPDLNLLLVPLFALGLINPTLLSLLVRMPRRGRALLLLGGLPIGGLAAAGAWFAGTDPGTTPDIFAQMARPLSAVGLVMLLGAGPVAVVLALPRVSGARWLIRLVAATFAAGLAAVTGTVVFGLLAGLAKGLPPSFTLLIALLPASYLLFHLQLLCIFDVGGVQKERVEILK